MLEVLGGLVVAKYSTLDLESMFDDFLDESASMFEIFGMKYVPSYILRECDPIAYRVTLSDWLDSLDDCDDCGKNPQDCECEQ